MQGSASTGGIDEGDEQGDGSRIRYLIRTYYAPFITNTTVASVVVVLFLAMAIALGVYGWQNLSREFTATDYLPKDSPLRDFFSIRDNYYGKVQRTSVTLDHPDLQLPSDLAAMCSLNNRLAKLDFVVVDTAASLSWIPLYATHYSSTCAEDTSTGWDCTSVGMPPTPSATMAASPIQCATSFIKQLESSGRSPFPNLRGDVRFADDGSGIVGTKFDILVRASECGAFAQSFLLFLFFFC